MNYIGQARLSSGETVHVHVGRYVGGGDIAVQLYTVDGEPYGRLSTNLTDKPVPLEDDQFVVKTWSENAPIIEAMRTCGLFVDTGEFAGEPGSEAPVWRLKDPAHVPPLLPVDASVMRPARQRGG